jgi:hypothetical protein
MLIDCGAFEEDNGDKNKYCFVDPKGKESLK